MAWYYKRVVPRARPLTVQEPKRDSVPTPLSANRVRYLPMDWSIWAEGLERALGPEGDFPSFFAPGALFSDPVNPPTSDLASIEAMTKASFPDWRQEIVAVHGDDHGGAFEWIGRGTLGGTIPIVIHGCTTVDVDHDGLVTRWRDYFDVKDLEAQIAASTPPTAEPRGS